MRTDKSFLLLFLEKEGLLPSRVSVLRLVGIIRRSGPKASISPDEPMEYAFEQVSSRFDMFLGRLHSNDDTQRGLIILDDSSYETSLQTLTREFRTQGRPWGKLRNLSDVPLFVNSKATRMIQYADMVAYALRRYYDKGEAGFFDIISRRFDAEGGVLHGLVHCVDHNAGCHCHACRQRRAPAYLADL